MVATVLPRWYGLAHIGAIQGVTVLVTVAASATGPVVLSLISDQLGSYNAAAWVLVSIPLLIGLTALAISEPEATGGAKGSPG